LFHSFVFTCTSSFVTIQSVNKKTSFLFVQQNSGGDHHNNNNNKQQQVNHQQFNGKNNNNNNVMIVKKILKKPPVEIEKPVSVPIVPVAVPIKHPLANEWTLWYFDHDRSKSWNENQHAVKRFGSVEEFWSLFSYIRMPSELPRGSDYSLFKSFTYPAWEDKYNKNGGRWVIPLQNCQMDLLDRFWIETVRKLFFVFLKIDFNEISFVRFFG
jgi:hypothetical protein